MKVVRAFVRQSLGLTAGVFALACCGLQQAAAQAPYLLPYTINNVVTPGTTPVIGSPCIGTNGVVGTVYDALGDGCPITSGAVVIGAISSPSAADLHDVGVDSQGNIYFIDTGATNGFIRRIDARSGIVTAFAGTASTTQPTANCGTPTPTQDKYGDGCPANDGKGNATPGIPAGQTSAPPYGYTSFLAKDRGLAVAKNGDVYLAGYNSYVIQRISLSTGILNLVAGLLSGGTAAAPKGYIGVSGYTGDGSIAAGISGAKINQPRGVTADLAGNTYIADTGNNVIRKVTASTGIITTVVGVNPGGGGVATAGATGDGGPATSATLSGPEDVEVDNFGNIYIADATNNKVRMVYLGGTAAAKFISLTNPGVTPVVGNIYTVVGGGAAAYAGTSVLATTVTIAGPRKMALDNRNNLYLADNGNNVIFFVDQTTGFIRILAGQMGKTSGGTYCNTTSNGDGCPGTQATLFPNSAMGVGVDPNGNVLISDSGNRELRRLSTNQIFPVAAAGATVTQTLIVHLAMGDTASATTPFTISGSPDFSITGTPTPTVNPDGTTDYTVLVAFKPSVAGSENAGLSVRTTLNGTSSFGLSGTGSAATVAFDPGAATSFATALNNPQGIAQDANGVTYIADTANNRVLRYTGAGTFTLFAGNGTAGYTGDNAQAAGATLRAPRAVAIARDGSVVIADNGNNVLRSVSTTGVITTLGGAATTVCVSAVDTMGDGCPALQASFNAPAGLAADTDGTLYVSDSGNNLIRAITPNGYSVYVAGGASTPCSTGDTFGNGCSTNNANFQNPTALALDANRNLYVADTGHNQVRKIGAGAVVTAVAGTGAPGASGNGGAATAAQLAAPTGVAVDAAGNVYIADTGNAAVRQVNSAGVINTAVGTLSAPGTGTLPGSAYAVLLTNPAAVVSNGIGRLVVLDAGNNRALVDSRGFVNYNFGRNTPGTTSPTLQIQETATGTVPVLFGTPLFTTTGPTNAFTLAGTGPNGCTGSATTPLPVGASCLLAANFTPQALGTVNAVYTEANANTNNVPTPYLALSGTGAVLTKTSSVVTVTGTPSFAVPFTATTTVTPAACNTDAPSCVPTGNVTFRINGVAVGAPVAVNAQGVATTSITGLSVGTYTLDAVYNGDAFYASSTTAPVSVTIARGVTKSTVTATPSTVAQFQNLTLNASVAGPITTSFPTGSFSFYAGSTLLGTSAVDPRTGLGSLADIYVAPTKTSASHFAGSFGLAAGVYQLTVVYGGDANYAGSTSAGVTLTISPQGAAFIFDPTLVATPTQLSPAVTGTAQGSTGQTTLFLTPSNTVAGTVTFACTGMPAHSDCTFSPTSLTFTPTPGVAAYQSTQVTLFTDVPDSALATSSLLGWPVLLTSLLALFGFRRKLRQVRLLAVIALFGALVGGSSLLSGCAGPRNTPTLTPPGVYNVTVTVKGSNAPAISIPIVFTVTAGVPGQL